MPLHGRAEQSWAMIPRQKLSGFSPKKENRK
jgi:hypothetical protein